MSFLKILLLTSFVFILNSCRSYEVINGEIPNEFLPNVQPLIGSYQGQFEDHKGTLDIQLKGNKPELLFHFSDGDDLISSYCNTHIGQLKKIYFKGSSGNEKLDYVIFNFDRGHCQNLLSDTIELTFKIKNSKTIANFSYLADQKSERVCRIVGGTGPHDPPHEVCEYVTKPIYYIGSFVK